MMNTEYIKDLYSMIVVQLPSVAVGEINADHIWIEYHEHRAGVSDVMMQSFTAEELARHVVRYLLLQVELEHHKMEYKEKHGIKT
jgi:hypothetical protein